MDRKHTLKDLFPMIAMYIVVIVLTIAKQFFATTWDMHSVMNDFMGIMFVVWACLKLVNLQRFVAVFSTYDLIAQYIKAYAYVYPFIELALGVCYLLRWELFSVNLLTFVLMTDSAIGIALKLAKKEELECACMGGIIKVPMTYLTLCENIAMALMALVMMLMHH